MINRLSRYTPIQPGIREKGVLIYEEKTPSEFLKDYVHCFWVIKSQSFLDKPFDYMIIPDGCVDIYFDFNNHIADFAGSMFSAVEIELSGKADYLGIRFKPGCITSFFNLSLDEVTDNIIPVCEIMGKELDPIIEKIDNIEETSKRIDILEDYLLKLFVDRAKEFDSRFLTVADAVYTANGVIEIEGLTKGLGISPQHLRRIFNNYVGMSPKKFTRIVRFQNMLQSFMASPVGNRNKICYQFGYYDQSHFIHEFTEFYGSVPSSL